MDSLKDLSRELDATGIKRNTARSALWFKQNIKKLGNLSRQDLLNDDSLKPATDILPGMIYFFVYDAKHKKSLPYFDRFPLIIMVDGAPGGFTGLNLHYLPPIIRYKFLKDLESTLSDTRYDERTRFEITKKKLQAAKKFRAFEPCFKHYLVTQIKSRVINVPSTFWDLVVYLPTEQFSGASKSKVWVESLRKM